MLFFSFFLFFGTSAQLKISHLNALLQFKDPNSAKTPHFTISAEGSCFNWTSLNSDIVRVIPNYQSEKCSTSALVEVVAKGPTRRTTAILAESSLGSTLKCDIFVDSVKKISILTTTRSIYLESSLETLSILAFDSENNTFTSLEGTEIEWKIDKGHIRTISTDEAKLFLPKIMPNKTASLIIQGTKIGETWAEATLNGIYHAHVDLVVVKALTFLPSPIIRTLPYHHIPFKLCSARSNNFKQSFKIDGTPIGVTVGKDHISQVEFDSSHCISQIQLPSNLYSISTSNVKTMTADQNAYATTHEVGESTITAMDASINDNIASTLVYVMYPSIVDQPEQYIALGDDPIFDPILKDKDGRPLDIFEPIQWEIIGEWKTVGTKHIKLKYHDFSFIAIVHVCPPLIMDPPEAVLPVHHNGYVVKPIGGSGYYEFSVDDQMILSYSGSSYKISTSREGRTKIRVQDKKIRKYHNYSDILVSKVAYIDIQIERRELINDYFQPKCDIYAIENKRFSVEITYKTISTKPDVVSAQMKAQNPGFSQIYCEAGLEGTQSAKVTVSAADYLRAEVKGRGSPNSIIPLTVAGGVLQWPESQPPTIEVTCSNAKVTNFHYNHFSVDREYNGYCTAIMQNKKTDMNPYPLKVTSDFWLNVSYVDHFDLYVTDEKASDNVQCNAPLRRLSYFDVFNDTFKNHIKAYRIVSGHLHKLFVFPRDIQGYIINYYSAVPFDLRSSIGEQLRPIDNHGRQGETVFHYIPSMTTDLSITSPDLNPSVTSLIEIKPIRVPQTRTVYYKPNYPYTFPIEEGSGYYKTLTQNAQFVSGNLQVTPQRPGTQLVSVIDSCTDQSTQYFNLNALSVENLQIVAPPVVFVNTEFDAQVKAYGQKLILIPEDLLPEAGITLKPDWSRQVKLDTWRLKPTHIGKLYLTATSENDVTTTTTVDVIDALLIQPQYIELLPGDRELISIITGPKDIIFEFEPNAELIAKVVRANDDRYAVVGLTPGNITINAYIKNHELMQEAKPFPIYVRVLRPISLVFDPSTKQPIQTGYIGLRLLVLTDAGYRIPKRAKWDWQPQTQTSMSYSYVQINSSYAFINLSSPSVPLPNSQVQDVIVSVEAYNSLRAEYLTPIEPKLIITTPQLIILPPHCTFQITIFDYGDSNMMQSCTFKPENETVVTCEGGLIRSYSDEGETTINVFFGHQKVAVTVRVSKPAFFHIHQITSSDIRLMLLDPYGLIYSSVNGVKFTLTGPGGFTASEMNSRGYCRVQFPSEDLIKLDAIASNSEFSLETSAQISVKQRIIPSNVVLMKGATMNFQCTSLTPQWSSSDASVLSISSDGSVYANRAGSIKISCGPNIYSKVTVTEMVAIELVNQPNDEFQIYPIYSPPLAPPSGNSDEEFQFKEPTDLKFDCIFEETSCASVYFKRNETGYFCVLKRFENDDPNSKDKYFKCPPKSKLRAVVSSESSNLRLTSEAPITYIGNIDFGVPNEMKFTVSDTKRKVEVPVKLHYTEVDVQSPKNIDVEWLPNDVGIVIRVDETFRTQGTVILEHKESGEKVTIDIVQESSPNEEKSLYHKREFKLSKEILFVLALIAMFLSILFIIILLTSD